MSSENDVNVKIGADIADLKAKMDQAATAMQTGMEKSTAAVSKASISMTAGMSAITTAIGVMAGAFAAVASLSFLVNSAKDAANFGDEITKTSQKTGIATDKLQELQFAAKMNDVSSGTLEVSLKKLGKAMEAASAGGKEQADAFRRVGIDAKDLAGMKLDDVLGKVADKFAASKDGTTKATLAMELFGRAGTELIPMLNNGSASIEQLKQKAHELGTVMDEQTVAAASNLDYQFKLINAQSEVTKRSLGVSLIPVMTQLTAAFADASKDGGIMREIFQMAGDAATALVGVVSHVTQGFMEMGKIIGAVFAVVASGSAKEARQIWKSLDEDLQAQAKKFEAFRTALSKPPDAPPLTKGGSGEIEGKKEKADPMKQYEAELEAQKVWMMRNQDFHEMTHAEEKAFWDKKISLNKGNAAILAELTKKRDVADLADLKEQHKEKLALAKMSGAEEAKIALEVSAAKVLAAQNLVALHKLSAEEEIAIERAAADEKIATQKKLVRDQIAVEEKSTNRNPKELAKLHETLAAEERKYAAEILAINQKVALNAQAMDDEIKAHKEKTAIADITAAETAAAQMRAMGQIDAAQEIEILQLTENAKHEIKLKTMRDDLAEMKVGRLEYQKQQDKILDVTREHEAAKQALINKAALETRAEWMKVADPIAAAMETAANSIIQRTASIHDAIKNMARSIESEITKMIIKTNLDIAKSKLFEMMGQGGGGATSNTGTGIGATGSGGFNLASLFSFLPAFADGTDYVPRTGMALIHQGERITPAAQNNPASMGTSRNTTMNVTNTFVMSAPADRATQDQIAMNASNAMNIAMRRNG